MTLPRYSVYGLTFETDHGFSYPVPAGVEPPDVHFACRVGEPDPTWWIDAEQVLREEFDHGGVITWHRGAAADLIDIAGISQFRVTQRVIECVAFDDEALLLVEIQLLGLVLAFWLERQQIPALHASAVVREGRAYAFLAPGGGGKTTIAATLVDAGDRLLTDDLLVLRTGVDLIRASPGYPQYRMWPADATRFAGAIDTSQRAHPGFDKRRVAADAMGGGFHGAGVPLAGLYFLERMRGIETVRPVISDLPVRSAVLMLLGNLMLADVVQAFGWAPQRLQTLADLCGAVPVRKLRYPDDHGAIGEVRSVVEDDMDRTTAMQSRR
ncbi:MAG TPA: hypothetical protein VLG28_15355 [Acidimicrobiia bacterium]|nr:hypothetical protein [Acidimicrobiia bacterium]